MPKRTYEEANVADGPDLSKTPRSFHNAQKRARSSIAAKKYNQHLTRKSERLQKQFSARKTPKRDQFPSPPSTESHKAVKRGQKRELSSRENTQFDEYDQSPKRPYLIHDPILSWADEWSWLKYPSQRGLKMSEPHSGKRRSSSTHRSDRLARLAENGVFMKTSASLRAPSKDLCRELLKGNHSAVGFSLFPADKFSAVLERVQNLNESRIQRDITPWVVPSAEHLFFCGKLTVDYIADEVNAEWIRCETMGGRRPKPDYAAGLMRKAFTEDEMTKLLVYSTPTKPLLFTPDLCFPFLMCEVKAGERGLNEADRQNSHSASIAVRAIIELYKAAFGRTNPNRVEELYGQILVFTVSHDHDKVCIYGHYAALSDQSTEKLEFYRYPIDFVSLSVNEGINRDKTSNFTRNLYEKFAPMHLQRIKDAASVLPSPKVQKSGVSFSVSELMVEEADSQQESQEVSQQSDEASFQRPVLPASAMRIDKLMEQMEQQRQQMEQQRQYHKDKEERMERQMEQQRQQIEQQKQQAERQMEQQREIISLLKRSKD